VIGVFIALAVVVKLGGWCVVICVVEYPRGAVLSRGLIPTVALAGSKDGVARGAGDVVGDDQFDVEAEICPSGRSGGSAGGE
jgi:hypothetical protein